MVWCCLNFLLTPGINRSSSVSLIPQCSEGEGSRCSPDKEEVTTTTMLLSCPQSMWEGDIIICYLFCCSPQDPLHSQLYSDFGMGKAVVHGQAGSSQLWKNCTLNTQDFLLAKAQDCENSSCLAPELCCLMGQQSKQAELLKDVLAEPKNLLSS